ncbi:methyltransferase domain-containing protein [Paroceanicella profunda]|uniref:Methyltransferase domain-containing protein n=1 Tax=Paroceanicella profunda TaxID=2579971 RepID=A0A5B8FUL5_9RHOB|nr:methyltransferase domain-containing protein [Paroceanicella profunda]QDL92075.1 methyltransferase domain-containing protein [Paroceanicella profunda]
MAGAQSQVWNPAEYARFTDLRLRPALDLLARVPEGLPPGDVVDLGCGAGAVGPALRSRFPQRRLLGLDLSPDMLEQAGATGAYDRLSQADIARWQPEAPPALVFSNAALHWVPEHRAVMRGIAEHLAPGAALAVQMPDQTGAPSHALLRSVSARMFPDLFDWEEWRPPVAPVAEYHAALSGFGQVDIWETRYLQRLAPVPEGHPVRHFTGSTAALPVLGKLDPAGRTAFLAAYDAALRAPYPPDAQGGVLFPFSRMFIVLTRR